jgi:hypothetical protein
MRKHFSETTGPQRLTLGLVAGLVMAALPPATMACVASRCGGQSHFKENLGP